MIKKIRIRNGYIYIVQKDEFTIADLNKILNREKELGLSEKKEKKTEGI